MTAAAVPRLAPLRVRQLGLCDYAPTLKRMQQFSSARTAASTDEIWLVQHAPVFTLGIGGGRDHLHDTGAIPVVESDRGGNVTYHGPGQLVAYLLFDLQRLGIGMRTFTDAIQAGAIAALHRWHIDAVAGPEPGVFVGPRKIASIGLRLVRRRTYHGIGLNVCNELGPFERIDPCGHRGLEMTTVVAQGGPASVDLAAAAIVEELLVALGARAGVRFAPENMH